MEPSTNKKRVLFYHDASDCYFEDHLTDDEYEEHYNRYNDGNLEDVTDIQHHEDRYLKEKPCPQTAAFYINNPDVFKVFGYQGMTFMDNVQHKKMIDHITPMVKKLDPSFKTFPMYQFFREMGKLQAYAVVKSKMMIADKSLEVIGVFLFEEEAEAAAKWMRDRKSDGGFTYHVSPTNITKFGNL